MSTPLLTACDLTVRFGGLTALDALNLTVYEGEVMGLLGPNGSGKTTFFNVVTGLYTAASGRIMLGSEDISTKSPQEVYGHGVTRTFQRSRLSLSLTVFDNMVIGNYQHLNTGLMFNIFRRAQLRKQYDEMVDKALTLLRTFNPGLPGKLFQPTSALTMIDRRRVEICRALLNSPRLLLLDEPSAGMTHDETTELMDDILQVRQLLKPFTIVIIEHEMNVIQRITDRCAVLNFGRKIAEGSYEEIVADREVQIAYLGQEQES
ncbi:ABC transporter ATP-binding protein [Alcaligenaceae bacterium]|nr:ABC transporter ATP-binding protein [Alcaligenaceae bacterium]